MSRRREIRCGTFERLVGTPVHANGWWMAHAAGVDLHCAAPSQHELSSVSAGAEAFERSRVTRALPIALQMADGQELPIGFVAMRVEGGGAEGGLDVAYPFLVMESDGRMKLAFGSPGPEPSVRDEIIAAFAERLLR